MHSKKQRIAAWVGIIILALIYLLTLLSAIFDFDGKGIMFRTCLIATIAVPILLWIYIWIVGLISNKHTVASVDYDFTAGLNTKEQEPSDADKKNKNIEE